MNLRRAVGSQWRRVFASAASAVAFAFLPGLLGLPGCGSPESPAHLLLITVDTLRSDRLGDLFERLLNRFESPTDSETTEQRTEADETTQAPDGKRRHAEVPPAQDGTRQAVKLPVIRKTAKARSNNNPTAKQAAFLSPVEDAPEITLTATVSENQTPPAVHVDEP